MAEVTGQNASFAELALQLRGFMVAQMISVAAELRLADRVAGGPCSASALGAACDVDPGMLLRPLPGACGIRHLHCRRIRRAGSVRASDRPGSVRTRRRRCTTRRATGRCRASATWGNLGHTVRTGEPAFIATLGLPSFERLKANQEDAERFDRFMQHSPDDRHRAVAEAFPLPSGVRVVDVGGGNGALLAALLAANPDPAERGVLFDRADVVATAPATLGPLADRCGDPVGRLFRRRSRAADIATCSAESCTTESDESCRTMSRHLPEGDAAGRRTPDRRAAARRCAPAVWIAIN